MCLLGGWRTASLAPLAVAVPTILWSLHALINQSNLWPITFILLKKPDRQFATRLKEPIVVEPQKLLCEMQNRRALASLEADGNSVIISRVARQSGEGYESSP
jgi:hypothetical protein